MGTNVGTYGSRGHFPLVSEQKPGSFFNPAAGHLVTWYRTKQDLINRISQNTALETSPRGVVVETFFTVVKRSVARGETIYSRGFGRFSRQRRAAKFARDIRRRQAVWVFADPLPRFTPSDGFVRLVGGPHVAPGPLDATATAS